MTTPAATAFPNNSHLPASWAWSTLGELSEKPQYGWTTKANHATGNLKLLRTTDITSGNVDWSSVPFCTEEPENVEKYVLRTGDILISRAGSVGVSFLINEPERAVFASYLIRFRPKAGIDTKYFYYYLKSPAYWEAIGASKSGIAVPNVNASKLARVRIPVAPMDQQKRIVAEIEKQFSRLDEAVVNLNRVSANVKRYKAAVLKDAVEGRLVETEAELARREGRSYETAAGLLRRLHEQRRINWSGRGKYKQPQEANTSNLADLPEGWVWASVEACSTRVTDGVHKKPNYVTSGIPFVTVRNLTAGDGISFDNLNYITEEDHTEFCKRTNPQRGDILITKDGTLGVVRLVDTDRPFSIFVSVALIKPVLRETAPYLLTAFQSPVVQQQMVPKGSGLQHIHLEDLRADCIPLPPLAEQRRIVAEVDRRLSLAREVGIDIDRETMRAATLKQRILHSFFTAAARP
jgi:type I restriction enzyme S subunit